MKSNLGPMRRWVFALALGLVLCAPAAAQAASFSAPTSFPTGGIRPGSVAVADFNGDGIKDLAVANGNSKNVGLLLGNGTGGFGTPTKLTTGDAPISVAADDLDGNGSADIAVANRLTGDVSVFLNNGTGGFSAGARYLAGNQPFGIAIGDVDGDHVNDLVVANRVSDSISVLINDGDGVFGHPTDYPAGDGPFALAVGDLDHDGDRDVVVAAFEGDQVMVLRNAGGGVFGAPDIYTAGNGPQGIALGDLREDTHTDIAAANFFSDSASVLFGNGSGLFSAQLPLGGGDGPKSIALGDVDGDGHLDLAIAASETDTVSILPGDGQGGFGAFQPFAAGDNPSSIVVAELNGGGLPEVVVADAFGEVVSVLLNQSVPDTTAPTITIPSDMVIDTTSPGGVPVSYSASVSDDRDHFPSVVCVPPSGSTFLVGLTTVNCSGLDHAGNTSTASFTVRVNLLDTTAPVITTPGDIVVDTPSPGGAAVTYAASASDDRDAAPTLNCLPASGSTFPIGLTTVNCTATDASGNSSSASFKVRVDLLDTGAPTITVPANIVRNTSSPAGIAVTYSASAADDHDAAPTLNCVPPSGSNFPVGETQVNCTASDHSGNSSSASFKVTVNLVDTTAPVIKVPGNITVNATSPSGAVVTYSASATDNKDASPSLGCVPASGATFPIGVTLVKCTAKDAAGNSSTASFQVYVKGAPEQLVDLIDSTLALRALGPVSPQLRSTLESVFSSVILKRKSIACLSLDLYSALIKTAGARGWVTTPQMNSLLADATRIKKVIGC
jgi:VCBS repeat protein/HYR domain-containing protein